MNNSMIEVNVFRHDAIKVHKTNKSCSIKLLKQGDSFNKLWSS